MSWDKLMRSQTHNKNVLQAIRAQAYKKEVQQCKLQMVRFVGRILEGPTIYAHIRTHERVQAQTQTQTQTSTHSHTTHTHTHTHTNTHTHTGHAHTYTQTHRHTHTDTP